MIQLSRPWIDEADLQAVRSVLESGYLVQGTHVSEFENSVATNVGVDHAVAVSSGTAALHLSLAALGVGKGDVVILPAYSFTATANVVELCGATPHFVDIDPVTFALDVEQLDASLKTLFRSGRVGRPKALLPVHPFGLMADMKAILPIAEQYGLPVVEDAACALGAALDGQASGTFGLAGCFSFHPRKAITTGEGGVVTTNAADLGARLRTLRNHGQAFGAPRPDFVEAGWNYRLTEIQAALGVSQMLKLEAAVSSRADAAARYDELLRDLPVTPPTAPAGYKHVYQSYVVRLRGTPADDRDAVINRLREAGVEASIGTYHMPLTSYYRERYGYERGRFPVTDDVYADSLSLPLYHGIAAEDQREVVDQLERALDRMGQMRSPTATRVVGP